MIDTIKIAVYRVCNESFFQYVISNSDACVNGFIIDNKTATAERKKIFTFKSIEYESYNLEVIKGKYLASHNYYIHFRCFDDRIEFEFSLPKLIYGSNCIEAIGHNFKSSPYHILKNGVKLFFSKVFPNYCINYGYVALKRFDFCYNQIFENKPNALACLKYIKLKYASKMDKLHYEYGHVELTKSKYFKIYFKGAELEKHDLKKLDGHKELSNFIELSNRCLRYEQKYTPKSWSYWYNIHYKYQYQEVLKKEYYLNKKNSKVTPIQRSMFERNVFFTLGNSKLANHTRLEEFVFNHLYTMFRMDIKRKYSVGNKSTSALKKEIIDNKKNKTMNLRILAFIKIFGSLKRAQESGAFSKKTLYRYNSYMNKKGLSTTKQKIQIKQDWSHVNYFRFVKNRINVNKLSNDANF